MERIKNRHLKRPSVERAKERNDMLLYKQKLARASLIIGVILIVTIVMYLTADVGLFYLGLTIFIGYFSGVSIFQLRAWGEKYRFLNTIKDSLEQQGLVNQWQLQIKAESKKLYAKLIFCATGVIGLVIWAILHNGRLWVILPSILMLTYALSSIKPLYTNPEVFMNKIVYNNENYCKIILFRSFTETASSLARNALAPILSGYGSVEIVLDDTFKSSESQGLFGVQVTEIEKQYKLHQFANTEWKDKVLAIIQKCDIAFIDMTTIRPGVIWEFAQCYKYLPPYRVFGVINAEAIKNNSLNDFLPTFYEALSQHSEMPTNVRPYFFVFIPNAWHQEALAIDIHRKMLEIIDIERRGQT